MFLLALTLLAAQPSPEQRDFSGRWVLEAPAAASPDAARVLVVDQPISRYNARGEPMKPAYLRVAIGRETPSANTEETDLIGIVGGAVAGRTEESPSPAWRSHYETLWQDDVLVFTSGTSGPDGARTGNWTERREAWSLQPDGRLRVETSVETRNGGRRVDVYLYRRERGLQDFARAFSTAAVPPLRTAPRNNRRNRVSRIATLRLCRVASLVQSTQSIGRACFEARRRLASRLPLLELEDASLHRDLAPSSTPLNCPPICGDLNRGPSAGSLSAMRTK